MATMGKLTAIAISKAKPGAKPAPDAQPHIVALSSQAVAILPLGIRADHFAWKIHGPGWRTPARLIWLRRLRGDY